MKKLIVSCKTADQVFDDFKNAARRVQKKQFKGEAEHEVSFDNKADFNRFVRNIPVLAAILAFKPRSIYELSKLTGIDVSNLTKTIDFFAEVGVVTVKTRELSGRKVREPKVAYSEVTFRLAA